MDVDKLVQMANRIGEFFQSMPDREEALREVSQHLRKFWEPRMRLALLDHLDQADGAGMLPIVEEAVRVHRDALRPASKI